MKLSFKRITSSGNFIPEIDGLRFIAIASVVLFHLSGFIRMIDGSRYTDSLDYSFIRKLLSHGDIGVPLFFVISGFILGLPFAKHYITNEKSVSLDKYFLRRLSRLEPPYILIMTILLLGKVYISNTISLNNGLISYLSSIFYSYNFINPGELPILDFPAWSLEIEVQFYILAPVMAYLFFLKSTLKRRLLLVLSMIFFLWINYLNTLPFISIANFIHFFIAGFLLSDLYASNSVILPKTKFDNLISLVFLSIIWLFKKETFNNDLQKFTWELIQLISIFFFYYYVLFHHVLKLLSSKLITSIGGMCYTIYLLHAPIISQFGNPLLKYSFSKYSFVNISIYSVLIITTIMTLSSIFFLLVERPCMDKDWYKKVLKPLKIKLK